MFESIAAFWAEYGNVLTDGVWDTLVMVVISTAFAYLIGLPLGVALILTQPHGIRPHRGVYRVLDWIVEAARGAPHRAQNGLAGGISGDLLAQDIREVLHHLGTITGEITSQDILNSIFSKFCIGN